MNIAFSKHTLANGLQVIVHEDHFCPIVAVNLWYHVGSKNEVPGRTGFAHLFEHLMFEGSKHHEHGYFRPLQEAGALLNGSTNTDRTNYWEVVPKNALELALWMESDRMGYLLPALTQAKLDNQRDVVLNERRQNYENRPYGLSTMALSEALFPAEHPYHWTTIGSADDIRAASLEEVRAFFARFYHPGNASLVVAGDVDTAEAVELAREYFEEIPAGPSVGSLSAPLPPLPASRRLVLEDRVELPRLYLAWRSSALFTGGDADLDLFADLIANGKTSRLYRTLVYERRLATDVAAFQASRELVGFFQLIVSAAPGHGLDEIEQTVDEELTRLRRDGPTADEVERALIQAETQFVFRLQTVGGFGGKADQLNGYNVFLDRPGAFDWDLARYLAVTPSSIREAAAAHLAPEARVTLSLVPRGRPELAASGSTPVEVS